MASINWRPLHSHLLTPQQSLVTHQLCTV